ncbi:LacI family DNA-binding transcriptional regulator [Aliiroseovarius sp. KMU-50]|uniref:LacI family DNA-binding transcriptional regulator n=1 Tax=Aliiroseovarius salicola TaxID=3009082 RepID=A0ABT4VZW1_9RHOB|nr:LacI family DNA-binding transcriptional regulator [Aliiroseovarius sp. KMU-50]MDA5093802.1 LacI family DNA-binding transcriptional regulator [Aliiroseovarius sp. KMU-50]
MSDRKDANEVTADDVAQAAGVSRWTVNRAFKPNASISAKSRQTVMEAAEKLGYAPNLLAASLASDRSNLVALLVDDFSNPHKLVMMERLTRVLRKNGWDTLLVNMLDKDDAPGALLSASQRRVDAAILIGVQFDDDVLSAALGARRVKKLIIFARNSENPDTISISVDDHAAMTEIADYVMGRDYQRPFFLAGPQTKSAHLTRQEAFVARWQEHRGMTPEVADVPSYDPGMAYSAIIDRLSERQPDAFPDVIVCENDALAIGAMDALRHHFNLRIPEDVAVTGFDDVPAAANPNYRITTYRQPITRMAERLVTLLSGELEQTENQQFLGQMVIRNSA